MRYGSVCSGIEAATAAWHPLGWQPQFFSEIDTAASQFLAKKYPAVPNYGDMTKFQEWPDHAIDLLVGGTPCQSFSVAGLRKGLADPRGNLMLTYLAIVDRYRPEWLVWENVPGVLSSGGGRDFGSFLGGLGQLGYGFAYRVLDAQFIRVESHPRAVPQRRRRVFVVGYIGDWRRAAAVLFERESLSGDSAPRRKAGKGFARGIEIGPAGGGFADVNPTLDARAKDGPIRNQLAGAVIMPADMLAFGEYGPGETSSTMKSRDYKDATDLVAVAGTMKAMKESGGWSNSVDHAAAGYMWPEVMTLAIRGRGDSHNLEYRQDGTSNAVLTPNGGRGGIGVGAIAFPERMSGTQVAAAKDVSPSIGAANPTAVVFDTTQITSPSNYSNPQPGDPCHPLAAGDHPPAIATQWAVRRLTPLECERLQGFDDGYTDVPPPNKNYTPDSRRYKQLGNSMAVNCMRWIGERISTLPTPTGDK